MTLFKKRVKRFKLISTGVRKYHLQISFFIHPKSWVFTVFKLNVESCDGRTRCGHVVGNDEISI